MSPVANLAVCAVDGGGTGCRAALAGATGAPGPTGRAGSANYTTDPEQAMANVTAALDEALARAGLAAEAARDLVAHVGLAGVLTAQDARAVAARLPFARVTVTDDRDPLVAGALGARDGVLLAVGTGSFGALRRGADIRYFGGWGLQLGDEASGAWLGRALLSETLRVADGLRAPSPLTRATAARWDGQADRIVRFASGARPADYAALAPEILAAAAEGDPVGRDLMQRGAACLADILTAAAPHKDEVLCLAGGLGPHYAPYLPAAWQARLTPAAGDALAGGIALAREALARDARAADG